MRLFLIQGTYSAVVDDLLLIKLLTFITIQDFVAFFPVHQPGSVEAVMMV